MHTSTSLLSALFLSFAVSGAWAAPLKGEPRTEAFVPESGHVARPLPCNHGVCPLARAMDDGVVAREPQTEVKIPGQRPHKLACKNGLCPLAMGGATPVGIPPIPKREPHVILPGDPEKPHPLPCVGNFCPVDYEVVNGDSSIVSAPAPSPASTSKREPRPFRLLPGELPIPCKGSACSKIVADRTIADLSAREPQELLPGEKSPIRPCEGPRCPAVVNN